MGTGLVVTDRDKGLPSAQRRGNCLGSSRWEPQAREAGCVESAGFRLADQPNGTGAGLRQRADPCSVDSAQNGASAINCW